MRAADSVEPEACLPAMRKVKFDGVTGTIGFDAKGNLQKPDFTVFTYKDGKRVRVAGS
jgi:branched-chain amino acid transport system substrate-binding protein